MTAITIRAWHRHLITRMTTRQSVVRRNTARHTSTICAIRPLIPASLCVCECDLRASTSLFRLLRARSLRMFVFRIGAVCVDAVWHHMHRSRSFAHSAVAVFSMTHHRKYPRTIFRAADRPSADTFIMARSTQARTVTVITKPFTLSLLVDSDRGSPKA